MELTFSESHIANETALSLETLYEPAFYNVSVFISSNGGDLDDAKDIFHDALVIYLEQHARKRDIDSHVRYITGISRHLWYKKTKRQGCAESLPEDFDFSIPEEESIQENRLADLLARAGRKCMDLLEAFYFRNSGIEEIKKMFGFASTHSASVQKYKCIEKLRNVLKTNSLSYEDFVE